MFKSYLLVHDVTFTNYIQKQKDDYDDGDDKVTENSLMAKGSLKHKILVKEGKYNIPTKKEQKIIALSAKFDEPKSKNADLTAHLNKKHQKSKKPKSNASDEEKWAWKKAPLTSGASSTKVANTKTYHWSINHAMWTIHTMADCNLTDPDMPAPPSPTTSPSNIVPTGQVAMGLNLYSGPGDRIHLPR